MYNLNKCDQRLRGGVEGDENRTASKCAEGHHDETMTRNFEFQFFENIFQDLKYCQKI
jgi:hypothetical protein